MCHMSNHILSKEQNMKGKSVKVAINHQIFLYALISRFDISTYRLIFLAALVYNTPIKTLSFYDSYLNKKAWNKKNTLRSLQTHFHRLLHRICQNTKNPIKCKVIWKLLESLSHKSSLPTILLWC